MLECVCPLSIFVAFVKDHVCPISIFVAFVENPVRYFVKKLKEADPNLNFCMTSKCFDSTQIII